MATIGVIGAGQMGAGIAQTAAQFGYDVLLTDLDLAIAEKGKAGIEKGLGRLVAREKMTQADATALAQAIVLLAQQPTLAKSLGQQGRRQIEERYSMTAMVQSYQQVYDQLLGRMLRSSQN